VPTPPSPGDIGVVSSPGWVAAAIRWITRAPVNHAFIYTGNNRIVEGWQTGVRTNDVYGHAQWLTNLSTSLTDSQRLGIVLYAKQQLGKKYSWLDDAAIGLADLFGWIPKWLRRRLSSNATFQCAQLCDAAYRTVGVRLFTDHRPPGAVSPGDLWRANQAREPAPCPRGCPCQVTP
jgi:uncharacterized protein YycO